MYASDFALPTGCNNAVPDTKRNALRGCRRAFLGKEGIGIAVQLNSAATNHQQHQGEHASNEQRQTAGFRSLHDELLHLASIGKSSSVGDDFKVCWVDVCVVVVGVLEPRRHGYPIAAGIRKRPSV